MAPLPDRLTSALSDRYRLERELGAGGMATVVEPVDRPDIFLLRDFGELLGR